jgi:multiple sugar transport system permease protein
LSSLCFCQHGFCLRRLIIGGLIFFAIFLAALRASARPGAAAPSNPVEELDFWSSFGSGQPKVALDKFVQEFNATHARLGHVRKLDMEYGQLNQKLLTSIAGGVGPGLVLLNRPNVASFSFRGALVPWDAKLSALGLTAEQFFPHCWNEGLWAGRQYCLPFNTDVRVLYYNRRLFREAGLDPDRPPSTWDELRTMSRQLTRRSPQGRLIQTGFVPIGGYFGNTYFPLFAYQNGDPLIEHGRIVVNGPGALRAMQWIVDFTADYGAADLMLLQTAGGTDELSLFLKDRVAMTGDEGYLLSLIRRYRPDMDFGVAPLPCPTAGEHATWAGGFGLVLPQGRSVTPLCAAFVQFLLSREVQLRYGQLADQIPARVDAARDRWFMQDRYWPVFIKELDHARSLPVSPFNLKMFSEMIRATERAVYGTMSPHQALDWVQSDLDREWGALQKVDSRPILPWRWTLGVTVGLLGGGLLLRLFWVLRQFRGMRLKRSEVFWGYILASPALLGLFGLALGPLIVSLILSFTDYDVLNLPRRAGLANYRRLFGEDPLFYKALWNTLYYTVFAVPLGVSLALGLALVLNRPLWGRPFWRAVFFLPSIFPIVAGSFLWLWLFNGEFGLINALLRLVQVPPVPWLSHPAWAKPALILMGCWGIGSSMIIFLAALQGVPPQLYEAGRIDGASRLRQFRHITLPLISPTIFFVIVISTIGSFQVFTQAYLTTSGGPVDSTTFYMLYLFRQAFEEFHMGYASALAWVLFAIIATLTWFQFRLSRRFVNYDQL